MSYEHLSLKERHYIEIERKAGTSMNRIAKALGRSQSTISREISRNTGQQRYRHKRANRFSRRTPWKWTQGRKAHRWNQTAHLWLSWAGLESWTDRWQVEKKMGLSTSIMKPSTSIYWQASRWGTLYTPAPLKQDVPKTLRISPQPYWNPQSGGHWATPARGRVVEWLVSFEHVDPIRMPPVGVKCVRLRVLVCFGQ